MCYCEVNNCNVEQKIVVVLGKSGVWLDLHMHRYLEKENEDSIWNTTSTLWHIPVATLLSTPL